MIHIQGTRWATRLLGRSSYCAAALALLSSSSAFATDGELTRKIKADSANLALNEKPLPAVVRQSVGRDAAIARLAPVVKQLLKGSSLKDGRVAADPDCSKEVCENRFTTPDPGSGRWEDGFDADAVIAVRATLSRGKNGRTADGVDISESEDGTLIHRPGIFSLRVLGDGSAFRWVNHLNGYNKHSNAAIGLDVKGAEELGRRAIEDLGLVKLSSNEELLFLKARQTRFTGQVADPGERPVAASIYFGRLINGVPVVGARGSTINIEVIAKGEIHSIAMDWSDLSVDTGAAPSQFAKSETVKRRLAAKSATATALACGYVDRGVGSPVGERLELGCFVEDRASAERYIVLAGPEAETRAAGPGTAPQGVGLGKPSPQMPAASDEHVSASEGGCSVAGPTSSSPFALLMLGGAALAFSLGRRRRWARKLGVAAATALAAFSTANAAHAASYSTFMFRDYDNNWQNALSSTQWVNYSDWKDEFDDVASCVQCLQPSYLDFYMHGHATTYGSDLIALSTHGTNSNAASWDQYHGTFVGKAQGNYAYSWYFEAPAAQAGATEIMLLDACASMPIDNAKMWGGYRNAFRRGNHVVAGCWGAAGQPTCSLYDTGVNTTWNEIGDELADSNSTVWFAWQEGFSVGWADDDIVTYGSGIINNHDCDDVANGVGWSNRNNYADYQFAHNQGLWSTYEVCGYYRTDW